MPSTVNVPTSSDPYPVNFNDWGSNESENWCGPCHFPYWKYRLDQIPDWKALASYTSSLNFFEFAKLTKVEFFSIGRPLQCSQQRTMQQINRVSPNIPPKIRQIRISIRRHSAVEQDGTILPECPSPRRPAEIETILEYITAK